jgi:hypothetical protein
VPEPFKPEPWARIENPDAAAILANPDRLRFLTPFIGCERSVSEAARVLEVSLNRTVRQARSDSRLERVRRRETLPRRG